MFSGAGRSGELKILKESEMRNGAYRAVESVWKRRNSVGKSIFFAVAAFVVVGALSVFSSAATKGKGKSDALKTLRQADLAKALATSAVVRPAEAPVTLLAPARVTDAQVGGAVLKHEVEQ